MHLTLLHVVRTTVNYSHMNCGKVREDHRCDQGITLMTELELEDTNASQQFMRVDVVTFHDILASIEGRISNRPPGDVFSF